MTSSINSIRGMHDILPADMPYWQKLESTIQSVFGRYGFAEIRVPLVEKTELFARAIGSATDVVEKEMYTFDDRGGDQLSLRPEGTAGVVRAVIQNNLLYGSPLRLWYCGPMFRRERPQKGRTRQFHQVGAEVFGAPGPDIDAELLAMCQRVWQELGVTGLRLEINSLGTAPERQAFRSELQRYFAGRKQELDEDSLRRLERNPLRILDSKAPSMQAVIADAPSFDRFLGDGSRAHFEQFRTLLEQLGVAYEINPRLVRGLDYYSLTVFEWITNRLGAQGTVCAGGRYDGLVELQGGKPWPGIGFAMGQERLVELMREAKAMDARPAHVFLVAVGHEAAAAGLRLAEELRTAAPSLRIESNLGGGSFKAQFKRADRSGADLALILGEEELQQGTVSVKSLRQDVAQQSIEVAGLADWFNDWLARH